jgi:preprotein translocase subunit SecB
VTDEAPSPAPLPVAVPVFPYQLVDAYLHSAEIGRRASTEVDPDQPTFVTTLETRERDDGVEGFLGSLGVKVEFKFRPEAVCIVSTMTTGLFVKLGDLDPNSDEQFKREDCAVLLWPYARTNVAELVRMTGLTLPPLPTIDVRTVLAVSPPAGERTPAK